MAEQSHEIVDLGKSAGKLMLQALPQGGKCIGFVGLLGADNARERIQGVKETIKGFKGIVEGVSAALRTAA